DVTDTRLCRLQILDRDTQVRDRVLETVLIGTKLGPLVGHRLNRAVNRRNGAIGATLRGDVDAVHLETAGTHILDVKGNALAFVRTNMERQPRRATIEEGLRVKLRVLRDAVDLCNQLVNFVLQSEPVVLGIRV